DRRKFVCLGELRLELDALGDIVHDNEPAYHLELARDQRRDGNIDGPHFAGWSLEAELVKVVNARVLPRAIELFNELDGENSLQRLRQSLPARNRVHHYHLRIPALDAILHIESHHANVDGFDDVLVEILQTLVLGGFLLQGGIKLAILDRDAEISAQGFKQLHVFAGEEIALRGLAKAQHSDGFLLGVARDVVIQV